MTTTPHLDPARGLVRGVRAAVLTVPAVGFATLAHATVDSCVSGVAVLLAVGLCWPAAVALLRCRRRLPALLMWLVAAQVVTHVLLQELCSDAPARVGLLAQLGTGLHPGMLTMHVSSIVLTAVGMGRADAGLWTARALVRCAADGSNRLWRRLSPSLPLGCLTAQPTTPPQGATLPARTLWDSGPWVRRGPPVLLAR